MAHDVGSGAPPSVLKALLYHLPTSNFGQITSSSESQFPSMQKRYNIPYHVGFLEVSVNYDLYGV